MEPEFIDPELMEPDPMLPEPMAPPDMPLVMPPDDMLSPAMLFDIALDDDLCLT